MATHLKPRLGLALAAAIISALGAGVVAQAQVPSFSVPAGAGDGAYGAFSDGLASKLYAVEVDGEAYLENNGTIIPLNTREIYIAEGSTVYTLEDSSVSMVISNGTGIFLGPNGRFLISRAAQEPFDNDRTDLLDEPSVSNIQLYHQAGTLGICTSRMVVGSLLEVLTDDSITRIPDGKVVFQYHSEDDEYYAAEGSSVTLVGGDISVQAGKVYYEGEGRDLGVRERIFFPTDGGEPRVDRLSGRDLSEMEGIVTIACLARRSVYFDAPGDVITTPDQAEGPDIVGTPTTPGPGGSGGGAPPTTVQPPSVVSPANI